MRTLLAVPVNGRGPHRGNLYLSEKDRRLGVHAMSDEESLVRFASQAAIALDNAHLHGQVRELGAARERIRIAHEMHDGLAQVLAYVNTKAQVVGEYLQAGQARPGAAGHLDQLAEAARRCYGDVREQILELRTTVPSEVGLVEAVTEYVTQWERQAGIAAELTAPDELDLAPNVELQLLRILQEALANVRKHSGATRVRVSLERAEGTIHVADGGRRRRRDSLPTRRPVRRRRPALRVGDDAGTGRGGRGTSRAHDDPRVRGPGSVHLPRPRRIRMRLLIADDHALFRSSLKSLLETRGTRWSPRPGPERRRSSWPGGIGRTSC
jgi:hypothetical protein